MNAFQDLQAKHEKLLRGQQAHEPILDDVKAYIEQVRAASSQVTDPRQRDQLRANLRFWAGFVFDQEKIYPNVELAPAAAPAPTKPWSPWGSGAVIIGLLGIAAVVYVLVVGPPRWGGSNPTATASVTAAGIIPTVTPPLTKPSATPSPTLPSASPTPSPTPTPSPAPTQTAIPEGIFAELVKPQDGQAVKPREQVVVRYQNLQVGWSLHLVLQPLSQGRRLFPAQTYLTVTAESLSGEWSPTVAFEVGDDLRAPQQYSVQLVLAIDEATRKALTTAPASGLPTLPPLTIPLPKITTVTRGAYRSVVDEDRLLFTRPDDLSKAYVLFTARPDGSDAHQLPISGLPGTLSVWAPSSSPSGQQIVLVGTKPDLTQPPGQQGAAIYSLWVMDSNGENARPIVMGRTGEAFERPLWSPDGRYIVYTLIPFGNRARSQIFLYDWRNPDQPSIALPISVVGSSFPTWFPDQDHLAFAFSAFNRPGVLGLLRYDLETGALAPQVNADGHATEPVVSPDGKSIAFTFYTDPAGDHDISIWDLGSGTTRLLTKPHSGLNQRPQWSPDNRHIFFETFRKTGQADIWVVNRDGSDEHPVVEGMASSYPFVGRLVAFFPLR